MAEGSDELAIQCRLDAVDTDLNWLCEVVTEISDWYIESDTIGHVTVELHVAIGANADDDTMAN